MKSLTPKTQENQVLHIIVGQMVEKLKSASLFNKYVYKIGLGVGVCFVPYLSQFWKFLSEIKNI